MISKLGSNFIQGIRAGGNVQSQAFGGVKTAFMGGSGTFSAIKSGAGNVGFSAADAGHNVFMGIRGGRYNMAAYQAGKVATHGATAWAGMGAINAFRPGDNIGLF